MSQKSGMSHEFLKASLSSSSTASTRTKAGGRQKKEGLVGLERKSIEQGEASYFTNTVVLTEPTGSISKPVVNELPIKMAQC